MNFDEHLQGPSLDEIQKKLKEYDGPDRIVTVDEVADEVDGTPSSIYRTGFKMIDDNHEGGLEGGELVVMTGPSGNGKTSFLMSMTSNMASHGVVWFTLEVTPKQFIRKLRARTEKLPLFYMPRRNTTGEVSWIEERILEAIAKHDSKIIFIDDLHNIMSTEEVESNTSLKIGRLVVRLKHLAVEKELVIVLVAHCRDLQKGEELHESHIRDSSMVKNTADSVFGIYRVSNASELHEPFSRAMLGVDDNRSKLLVLKNRRTGMRGYSFLTHKDHYLYDTPTNDIW